LRILAAWSLVANVFLVTAVNPVFRTVSPVSLKTIFLEACLTKASCTDLYASKFSLTTFNRAAFLSIPVFSAALNAFKISGFLTATSISKSLNNPLLSGGPAFLISGAISCSNSSSLLLICLTGSDAFALSAFLAP